MKNPKKGPFDLSVDLEKIPSYRSRFATMDKLVTPIDLNLESVDPRPAMDADNLRKKLRSGQDPRSNPSTILRRKGVRV